MFTTVAVMPVSMKIDSELQIGTLSLNTAVHPDYQGRGIGHKMMEAMQSKYSSFHQQMLTADGEAIEFYKQKFSDEKEKTMSTASIRASKSHSARKRRRKSDLLMPKPRTRSL